MIKTFILLYLFTLSGVYSLRHNGGCSVKIRGSLGVPTPLILEENAAAFVEPNRFADIVVEAGEVIDLYCSDSFTFYNAQLLQARCVSGVNFEVNGSIQPFRNFRCKTWPSAIAKYTGQSCATPDGKLISVGFEVSKKRYVEQYESCFDTKNLTTYWSKYLLGPYSKYYQTQVERINFRQDDFFGNINVNILYTKHRQLQTISNQLSRNAIEIDFNAERYLTRGHLAAKADFMFGAQQQATFMYINAAPQWREPNAANWGTIEIKVRELANARRSYLLNYSGTYGVSTLPNRHGEETPLYLYVDRFGKKIPVPKLYYRVVYELSTKAGVVLITVNDPNKSLSQLRELGYILCDDVSEQLSFFEDFTSRTNLEEGYTYACTIPDFAQHVPELPKLSATGGLLY